MSKSEREQKQKAPRRKEAEESAAAPVSTDKGERLKEDMDKLLDEIDSVLEENAEEFIKNYVQKGGE